MKKILLALCVAIVAVGVVKFAIGEGQPDMTRKEFSDAINEDADNATALSIFLSNLSDSEIQSFIQDEKFVLDLKMLFGFAIHLQDGDLNKQIKEFIQKIFDVDTTRKAQEIFMKLDENERIRKYLKSVMEENEDNSVELFARACKAISE